MILTIYQGLANPVAPGAPERVSIDKWHPNAEIPRFDLARNQYLYPSEMRGDVPRAERTTPDKWYQLTENPVWDLKRTQYLYPFYKHTEFTLTEKTSMDKWYQLTSTPLFDRPHREWLYPTTSFYTEVFIAETIKVDEWHPAIEQPIFDLKRLQHLYPDKGAYVGAAPFDQLARADRWIFRSPDPFKGGMPYPMQYETPFVFVQQQIQLSSFFQNMDRPRFDIQRRQYLYPSLALGDIPRKESPYGDKYYLMTNIPRWDIKRLQWLYMVSAIDPHSFILPPVNISDEAYFRKWLDDPTTKPIRATVAELDNVQLTETGDTTYFRKWLLDPGA